MLVYRRVIFWHPANLAGFSLDHPKGSLWRGPLHLKSVFLQGFHRLLQGIPYNHKSFAVKVVGKDIQTYCPHAGEIHGDEFHGNERIKHHFEQTPLKIDHLKKGSLWSSKHWCSRVFQSSILWVFSGHFLLVGGWTNPSEEYARQKLDPPSPNRGEHSKNIWNYHLQ